MTYPEDNKKKNGNLLNIDGLETLIDNQRFATRYIREDIAASISDLGFSLSNLGKFNLGKSFAVELMDITSKGVLISTGKKLKLNQMLNLTLEFNSGKLFLIKAKVARISSTTSNNYGLIFDHYHNELGEYLLETQSKLVFK